LAYYGAGCAAAGEVEEVEGEGGGDFGGDAVEDAGADEAAFFWEGVNIRGNYR
jgi:hypothetical protein